MSTKHYLVISRVVNGIIGSVLSALLVSPVTAQKHKSGIVVGYFEAIECTKLTVVDANGVPRMVLSTNALDGLLDDNIRVRVIGSEHGGGHS